MKEKARETDFVKIKREPEARIALCKCKESKKTYGIRMEKTEWGWNCTWAFPISEASAKREGYDATVLKGMIGDAPEYNGCPYCRTKLFVVCAECQKLNCQIITGSRFTCEWCGCTGYLSDYDGAGIQSGSDR